MLEELPRQRETTRLAAADPFAIGRKWAGTSGVVLLAVAVGVALQLAQFFANRSLSLDESFLALNVIHEPFPALFSQLDFNQGAPPLFLSAEKLVVSAFGEREYSLRLIPLLAGIAALLLFPGLARQTLRAPAVPIAVALLALSDPFIYYATTDKQYAVDVLAAILVLRSVIHSADSLERASTAAALGVLGAVIIWFSHASLFVLAGAGTTLVVASALQHRWRRAAAALLVASTWLASFGVLYRVSLTHLAHLQETLRGRPGAFVGASVESSHDRLLSVQTLWGNFRVLAGVDASTSWRTDVMRAIAIATVLLCLLGFVSLLGRRLERGLLLVSPLPFLFLASATHKYPLLARTLLFLLPPLFLLLAEGIAYGLTRWRAPLSRAAFGAAGVAVLATSANASVRHVVDPRSTQQMKPVMNFLAHEQRSNDTLYLYYGPQYSWRYYIQCRCAPAPVRKADVAGLWPLRPAPGGPAQYAPTVRSVPPHFLVARFRDRDPRSYFADFRALRGRRRVWILISDLPNSTRAILVAELDRLGLRRSSFRGGPDESSAVVYLYDFSR